MHTTFRFFGTLLGIILCVYLVVFAIVGLKWFFDSSSNEIASPHVEVIDLSGVIYRSQPFLRELEEILENPDAKAIVVRVNSPGGLVAPSQEIYEALRRADQKVPVIISMASLAASGGYYVALGGRKIFANPGTLTGSIGVIMEFVNTEKLYQWAKLDRFNLKSGKYKDIGSPTRPMRDDEKELLNSLIMSIYSQFRGAVRERRGLTDTELDKHADGRIFTGEQALAAKLVDGLLDFDLVLAEAKKIAKLPESTEVQYPDKKRSLFERVLGDEEAESHASLLLRRFLGIPTEVSELTTSLKPGWQLLLLAPVR